MVCWGPAYAKAHPASVLMRTVVGWAFLRYLKPQVGWVLLLNPGDDLFGGLAGLGPG